MVMPIANAIIYACACDLDVCALHVRCFALKGGYSRNIGRQCLGFRIHDPWVEVQNCYFVFKATHEPRMIHGMGYSAAADELRQATLNLNGVFISSAKSNQSKSASFAAVEQLQLMPSAPNMADPVALSSGAAAF
ncbi:uncharacterized protein LOC105914686 [Setaria italica]|uniref:uncharacterized protein LOC105914686 n=1 Tax=Setaria italica TaxID=4555 RepID=UPI000646DA7F|nr:uncharacterized protein LOC105914686 [Setaria italica]